MRIDGALRAVEWEVALNAAAEGLQKVVAAHGASARRDSWLRPWRRSRNSILLAQIARGLGCANIDHRLRQLDFRDQENDAVFPHLGLKIADVDHLEGVLVIGSNLRHEMPMLAHRIRKAAVKGAKVAFLNPRRFDYMFPVAAYVSWPDGSGRRTRGAGARGRGGSRQAGAGGRRRRRRSTIPTVRWSVHCRTAPAAPSFSEPWRSDIRLTRNSRRWPAVLAQLCSASVGCITEGANAAGAYLAGAVPHRAPGGAPAASAGPVGARHVGVGPQGLRVVRRARSGVGLCGGCGRARRRGTRGRGDHASSREACARRCTWCCPSDPSPKPPAPSSMPRDAGRAGRAPRNCSARARPGWKVLRVLANLLNIHGVDYVSSEEIREALKALCGTRIEPSRRGWREPGRAAAVPPRAAAPAGAWVDIPPYQVRCAGARLRGIVENQGRAHDPHRDLNVAVEPASRLAVRRHHAVLDLSRCCSPVQTPDGHDLHHSHHGVLHAGGAQGHRLDPGAQGSEPHRRPVDSGFGAAVCRRRQTHVQGNRHSGGRERIPVPSGAVSGAGPVDGDLGGDSLSRRNTPSPISMPGFCISWR